MKKILIPILFTVSVVSVVFIMSGFSASSGKDIFGDQKCAKCHTIQSQGIARTGAPPPGKVPPDLSGVGLKHTPAWMTQWLTKQIEMNGKKHLKKFTGSDAELKTLTTWLASLQAKGS